MINIIEFKATDKQGRDLPYYSANALDKHFIVCRFRVKFGIVLTGTGNSISVTASDDILILNSGSWSEYGAIVGAGISGTINGVSLPVGATIDYVNDNVLNLSVGHGLTAPANYTICDLTFDFDPQAVEFSVNLVPSNSNGFPESLVDQNVNRYLATGVDSLIIGGATADFNNLGYKSGGSAITPIIERFADEYGSQVYEIRFDEFTQFLYLDGSPFTGADSVKLWMNIKVFPDALDNGTFQETNYLTPDGQTGFFDEVFDGIITEFEITDIDLTVGGDLVSQVDYSAVTHFQIKVKAKDGSAIFDAVNSRFGIGFFSTTKTDSDNWNQNSFIENNTMLCSDEDLTVTGSTSTITGLVNSSGAGVDIENFEIFVNVAETEAVFVGDITPNAQYTSLMFANSSADRGYRLVVKVESFALTGNLIRPVWLTGSFDLLTKYIAPLGGYTAVGFTPIDHKGNAITYVPDLGFINTEDDIKIGVAFKLPKQSLQITDNRFYQSITLSVVAVKFTGELFRFESFNFPLGTYLPNETQPISATVGRGFTLPPSTDKNMVTIWRDTANDTMTQFAIKAEYGLLMDWRYWLAQSGVNPDFFGSENKDWFHYQTADWDVQFLLEINTTDGSYQNFLDLEHLTYDDWGGTSTINFYLEDGVTPITKPISGQICVVEAVHIAQSPYTWQPLTVWGQITVEPKEGAPRRMSSTVLPYGIDPSNPLIPLSGEIGCQLTIVGNTATLRTQFNPDLIDWQNDLSFSSKIWGEARKGVDIDTVFNRTKINTDVARKTSIQDQERILKECCEARTVVVDIVTPSRSDITAHWWAGDTVEFTLYKNGVATDFLVDTIPIPSAQGWFSVQLNWFAIYGIDGAGCYQLKVTEDVASIESTYTIENYELFKYSREITKGQARLMVLYDFVDVKSGIDFTGSNLTDSVRFHGSFGWSQPNLQVDNATDYSYSIEKVRRISRDTYEMKAHQLSAKFKRLMNFMLLHENVCWFTDYNWQNDEYYLDLVHVIVNESPKIVYRDALTRKVGMTCVFRAKLDNNISAFNSPNASKVPPIINIQGNFNGENTTVNIYDAFGNIVFTQIVPYGDDATFNAQYY